MPSFKKSNSVKQTDQPKKNKLRTSVDVYNRLKWDDSLGLDLQNVLISYQVNFKQNLEFFVFSGFRNFKVQTISKTTQPTKKKNSKKHKNRIKQMTFPEFMPIDQGGDIPFHKITQYHYNDDILWDREQRIDNLFRNSGIKQQQNQNNNTTNDNTNDPSLISYNISLTHKDTTHRDNTPP